MSEWNPWYFWRKNGLCVFNIRINDSEKTHVIYGNFKDPGFIPLSFNDFFSQFSVISSYGKSLEFSCNFLEIFGNSVYDLLGKGGKKRINLEENLEGEINENINFEKVYISKITDLILALKVGKEIREKGKFKEKKGDEEFFEKIKNRGKYLMAKMPENDV